MNDGALPAAARERTGRLDSLDRFKGGLVLLMVVYHSTIVLGGPDSVVVAETITHQLHFLHPAFLFVTGFLVGFYYWPKVAAGEAGTRRRLLQRGLKLYAVFFLCNLLLMLADGSFRSTEVRDLFATWSSMLYHTLLDVPGHVFSFEILAYIALFLLLASVALSPGAAFVGLLVCLMSYGIWSLPVARFLSAGFLGILVGVGYLRYPNVIACCVPKQKLLLTLFVVSRPVFLWLYIATTPVVRELIVVVDILAWWSVFHFATSGRSTYLPNQLGMLGKQSLFAYLFHLLLIQLLLRTDMVSFERWYWNYLVLVALVTLLTWGCIRLILLARARDARLRFVYRLIFE